MRGADSRDRRREVSELADEGHCAIFATVADEGTDIPRLDRLHLTWPSRKARTLTQQVGRVLRRHPEKREVIIIDYADLQQPVFRSQVYARLQTYRKLGYPVDGL
jgi:superfamily II DNA or RNA helicase